MGKCKFGDDCKLEHVCENCGQPEHGRAECPKLAAEGRAGQGRGAGGQGRVPVPGTTWVLLSHGCVEAGWRTGRAFVIGSEGLKRRPPQ